MFDFIRRWTVEKKIRKKLNLQNKKVVVMGIGLHGGGVTIIKWLLQQGARVVATDKKTKDALKSSLVKLKKIGKNKKLQIIVGRHRADDFRSADLIIKNPMIPWHNTYIKLAQKNNIPVEMDSSLFFKLCPSKKIIGITGTKGKTSTAYIIEAILKKAGKKTVLVGVGQLAVMNKLKLIDKNTYVIFELSSWRLSALRRHKISPHFSVVTNIFPDHLNYYKSMKSYLKDKLTIVQYQKKNDLAVLNYDDKKIREFAEYTKANISFFSARDNYSIIQDVYLEDEFIKYRTDSQDGSVVKIKELKIFGEHNLYNVMAGVSLALHLKILPRTIKKALTNFPGVPHRLEFIRKEKEVIFYNDSAATTPEATIAGINALKKKFGAVNVYIIAGGSSKNLNLQSLADKFVNDKSVVKIVLLKGLASDDLQKKIKLANSKEKILANVDNMTTAVELLYNETKRTIIPKNDNFDLVYKNIILLSPGCASFGLFDNEFDRGNQFREAVNNLFKK